MRRIFYACPYCNRSFKDEYMSEKLICRRCGSLLEIKWLSNGKQKCGIVGTTLVCFWGSKGSVILPNNITKIGVSVFENSPYLIEVNLSNTEIEEIGENAFRTCFRLQNIELPKTLKIIRKNAFYLTGFQKLFIPKSVELIEESAFALCSLIKEIVVDKENPYFYVQNECLMDKRTNQKIITCCDNKVFFKITPGNFGDGIKSESFNIIKFSDYEENRIIQILKEIEQSEDKFIVCEADTPINNITYLQATGDEKGFHIEFHLQKSCNDIEWENWSCTCGFNKCIQYIFSFIRGEFIPNFDEWELEYNSD